MEYFLESDNNNESYTQKLADQDIPAAGHPDFSSGSAFQPVHAFRSAGRHTSYENE